MSETTALTQLYLEKTLNDGVNSVVNVTGKGRLIAFRINFNPFSRNQYFAVTMDGKTTRFNCYDGGDGTSIGFCARNRFDDSADTDYFRKVATDGSDKGRVINLSSEYIDGMRRGTRGNQPLALDGSTYTLDIGISFSNEREICFFNDFSFQVSATSGSKAMLLYELED